MTTEEDLKNAERTALVKILNALGDKKVIGVFVAMILALCAYIASWAMEHTTTQSSLDKAAPADYCCAVKKAAEGNGAVATNALAKFSWLGCAASACQPKPQPKPAPTPTVDAGPPPAPSVDFPQCNPGGTLMAPSPAKIEQWKRMLPPRHKISEKGLFLFGITADINPVFWDSNIPWCGDQGAVGACEAFTQLDIATAKPRTLRFATQAEFNSAALKAYEWITANDPYPGTWPQLDTGSDSLSGCKWLVTNGYARACQVLNGSSAVMSAIQVGPIISGMNWRSRMYIPGRCGELDIGGIIDGGHAVPIKGYNPSSDLWQLENHWGNEWGICKGTHCGYFVLTTKQLFGTELDADFVQPVM